MLDDDSVAIALRMRQVWEKHAEKLKRCGAPSRYQTLQKAHIEKAIREFCYEMEQAELSRGN